MSNINFTVSFDPDDQGYIVHEVSNAFSFARVPVEHSFYFGADQAKAWEQVRRLKNWQAKGHEITLRNIETPARFEAVADTKYGAAWE